MFTVFCLLFSMNIGAETVNAGTETPNAAPRLEKTKSNAAPTEVIQEFSGTYKEVTKNKGCPEGQFKWIENNASLIIGGARPVTFNNFNGTHSRKESFFDELIEIKNTNTVQLQPHTQVTQKTSTITSDKNTKKIASNIEYTYTLSSSHLPSENNPRKKVISLKIEGSGRTINCSYEK